MKFDPGHQGPTPTDARLQVRPISGVVLSGYDKVRNLLHPRPHHHQLISANHCRLHVLCATTTAIRTLQTA